MAMHAEGVPRRFATLYTLRCVTLPRLAVMMKCRYILFENVQGLMAVAMAGLRLAMLTELEEAG